jgi:hypothetical protein
MIGMPLLVPQRATLRNIPGWRGKFAAAIQSRRAKACETLQLS